MKVRLAGESELPTLVEELTGYMDAARQVKYERKFTRYVRHTDKGLLVAEDATGALGFLCVAEYDEIPESLPPRAAQRLNDFATVTSFIVRPEHRGRGIGTSLFTHALEWGKERKPHGMWLITHRTGPWYQRHFGLEEIARIEVDGVYKAVMIKEYDPRDSG